MKISFLSYFIDNLTPVYGGHENQILISKRSSLDNGDSANSLNCIFNNHIGTHIDVPYHFSNSGKKLSDYEASFWVFSKIGFIDCNIFEVPQKIKNLPTDIEFLILKTGFGKYRGDDFYWKSQPIIPSSYAFLFRSHFPYLRVFGFDLISLTSRLDRDEGKRAHRAFLLDNDILIVEDMNLQDLSSAPDKVVISPLQISGADGAPCTIISINSV
jgi:arylformamidase